MSTIFISHNSKDKDKVEPIVIGLSRLFGQDSVFYDSWAIQPGDSIIEKMNDALSKCTFFFVFLSKNALNSKMVEREWQSALYKRTYNGCEFVPVLLEPVEIPALFRDMLYLNYYLDGPDKVLEQMVGIIKNINLFKPLEKQLNVRYTENVENGLHTVVISADFYVESIAHYLFISDCNIDELAFSPELGEYTHNIIEVEAQGNKSKAFWLSIDRPLAPGFPVKIVIKHINSELFELRVYREVSSGAFELLTKKE